GADRHGVAAAGFDLVHDAEGGVAIAPVVDDDRGSGGAEGPGDALADSGAGARDQGSLSLERLVVHRCLLRPALPVVLHWTPGAAERFATLLARPRTSRPGHGVVFPHHDRRGKAALARISDRSRRARPVHDLGIRLRGRSVPSRVAGVSARPTAATAPHG